MKAGAWVNCQKSSVMERRKILILAGKGSSTNIVYHSLKDEYDVMAVILENPVPRKEFLKRRIRKLGSRKVIGQVLFQFTIVPILNLASAKRKKEILQKFNLSKEAIPTEKIVHVNSVNSPGCVSLIKKYNPELIIVNGTRIISKKVLQSTSVKFLNIHAGITPKYRNVHGAYWAVVNNDLENCGVTVHLLDQGIDTGPIIYQQKISITPKDNFVTYPLLQTANGISILKKAITDVFEYKVTFKPNNLESKTWYHPTFWQYIYHRLVHKKK